MGNGASAARGVAGIVIGIVAIVGGAAAIVAAMGSDSSLLVLLGGIALAVVGAVLVAGNLRKGIAGDASATCPGCMDPIVPGAERCPNCGHVYGS